MKELMLFVLDKGGIKVQGYLEGLYSAGVNKNGSEFRG